MSFTPPGIFVPALIPFFCASLNSSAVAPRVIPFISLMVGFFEEEGTEVTEGMEEEAAPGTEVEELEEEAEGL